MILLFLMISLAAQTHAMPTEDQPMPTVTDAFIVVTMHCLVGMGFVAVMFLVVWSLGLVHVVRHPICDTKPAKGDNKGVPMSVNNKRLLDVIKMQDLTVDGLRALHSYFKMGPTKNKLKTDLEQGLVRHFEARGVDLVITSTHITRGA